MFEVILSFTNSGHVRWVFETEAEAKSCFGQPLMEDAVLEMWLIYDDGKGVLLDTRDGYEENQP